MKAASLTRTPTLDAPAARLWLARYGAIVAGASLTAAALAMYLATRSPWLDDWDSYNFARALSHFDVRLNQPQPPGYPVYVLLGRALNLAVHDPQLALTLLSALCGAGAVLALYALAEDLGAPWAALPLATMPLFWLSAGMALSDVPGLCLATAAAWLLVRAADRRDARLLFAGCAVSGLAAGVRPQDAVVPFAVLCLYAIPRWLRAGSAGGQSAAMLLLAGFGAALVGVIAWVVPLIANLGGPTQAWQVLAGQGQYVGGTDSLLARPLTAGNIGERLAEFGSVFSAYFGGPLDGGLAAVLALSGAAIALALASGLRQRLTQLALAWLLPYSALMLLALRPDDPRKILPAIPPLLLLLAGALRRVPAASALACVGLAVWFGAKATPLLQTLDTEAPAPNQAVVYVASHTNPTDTVVVAGASYNAVRWLQPNLRAYLLDDLNKAALDKDLANAKKLIVLDKEGFTPPATWVATDTRTFQRNPLVLPKASQVWLEAYEPLPGGLAELALPPGGAIHIGTADDIRYLLDGWNRPETIAGVPARWADRDADVRFYTDRAADATLTLVGVAYPAGQQLTVAVNGQPAAQLAMVQDWAPYSIFLPAGLFHPGAINTVSLEHSAAASAFEATAGQSLDRRPLAAAYQVFGIAWR